MTIPGDFVVLFYHFSRARLVTNGRWRLWSSVTHAYAT